MLNPSSSRLPFGLFADGGKVLLARLSVRRPRAVREASRLVLHYKGTSTFIARIGHDNKPFTSEAPSRA